MGITTRRALSLVLALTVAASAAAPFAQAKDDTRVDALKTGLGVVTSAIEIGLGAAAMATGIGAAPGAVLLGKGVLDLAVQARNIVNILDGKRVGASSALGELGGWVASAVGGDRKKGEMIGDVVDMPVTVVGAGFVAVPLIASESVGFVGQYAATAGLMASTVTKVATETVAAEDGHSGL
jgi:hypothetical protein